MLPSLLFQLLHFWKPYLAKIKLGYSSGLCFPNSRSNWSPCGLLFWPCSEYSAWVHWFNSHGDPMRRHCYPHFQEEERLGKYPVSQSHPWQVGILCHVTAGRELRFHVRRPEFKSYRSWGWSDEVDREGGDYIMVWWGLGVRGDFQEERVHDLGSWDAPGVRNTVWTPGGAADPCTTPGCWVWRGGDSGRKDAAGSVSKSWRQISNCTSQMCGS